MYFEKNNQVRYFTNQIENRKSYYSTNQIKDRESYCFTNQIKNKKTYYFTNQINRKSYYSTITNGIKLNPWFITGFSDAECSFIILIYKKSR